MYKGEHERENRLLFSYRFFVIFLFPLYEILLIIKLNEFMQQPNGLILFVNLLRKRELYNSFLLRNKRKEILEPLNCSK